MTDTPAQKPFVNVSFSLYEDEEKSFRALLRPDEPLGSLVEESIEAFLKAPVSRQTTVFDCSGAPRRLWAIIDRAHYNAIQNVFASSPLDESVSWYVRQGKRRKVAPKVEEHRGRGNHEMGKQFGAVKNYSPIILADSDCEAVA